MTGWFVTNAFLHTKKFEELYSFFRANAQNMGIELRHFTSAQLSCEVSSNFSQFGKKPDFVLFWDKDVHLAKRLENEGLRLFNSAHALEICDSKARTALSLVGKVPTPNTIIAPKTFESVGYTDSAFLKSATKTLGLPMVIKEEFGSFGEQVYLAKTLAEAQKIVYELHGKSFVMQKFIAESTGKDVRINVVGNKVVCGILRKSTGDFRSNVTLGGAAKKHVVTKEEAQVALAAAKAVGADFAGVDILFGKDGPVVCEVNSNPHFKSTLDCTGIDLSQHILKYIIDTTEA